MRNDGRADDELRIITMEHSINKYAEGSVRIACGGTIVNCTATVEEKVPGFMKGQGKGWVNAEYAMLPRATQVRNQREAVRGKLGGRTMEISRLVARSLRSIIDLTALGERTITIDCDVLQADGGTRCASITGGYLALAQAIALIGQKYHLTQNPLRDYLAAVSVGIIKGDILLDLNYQEDMLAAVDVNIIMTGSGRFVEVQGTGEEATFSRVELNSIINLAERGIQDIISQQRRLLSTLGIGVAAYE
jgi:ribonuclease PH